jgi:sporulation protein YlmC with PRC-barrel domain
MRPTILGAAAAIALALAVPALAQTTTPPAATSPSGEVLWYSHQPEQMRASKLIGTKVVNAANESIGDVNEIIIGKDGKVAAVIIGVGGFLGMGEREVAINYNSLRMNRDSNANLVLTVNATKDALKNAPAWRWEDSAKR